MPQYKKLSLLLTVLFFISQPLLAQTEQQPANMVIQNGTIYTVNDEQPTASFVAIQDDRIIYVGDDDEAFQTNEETRFIDLKGKTMTPGLIESHGHLAMFAFQRGEIKDNPLYLDLSNTSSFEEVIEKVEATVQIAEKGERISGEGWHQDKWDELPEDAVKGMPVHDRLSRVSPNNPVDLGHASTHAAMYNAYAMELAGLDKAKAAEFNRKHSEAEIIVDEEGHPTGVFLDGGYSLIGRALPRPDPVSKQKLLEWIISGLDYLNQHGITGFHDMKSGDFALNLYKEAKNEGKLNVRMYLVLNGENEESVNEWFEKGPLVDERKHWIDVRAVKLMGDGALGSYGAWLLEPYSDRPETSGLDDMPLEQIRDLSERGLKNGFQMAIHAIGDRANREVLDIYEELFEAYPELSQNHRWRIEHAQHIDPDDIGRFGELGVIASMQGIHLSSDRPWAIDRLGKNRIEEGAYVWQKLIRSGARIVNGSDIPVESVNPIYGFYASVTRKTLEGTPERGYEPGQKMTRMQALKSYTINPAYASFMEDVKGSIEVGKLADFTVFDQDIMTISEEEILNTEVSMTIVGGEIVYENKVDQQ